MRKRLLSISVACLVLTGCLETTQEITLNEDGSGSIATISDMSSILELARQLGGFMEPEKEGVRPIDTTISLAEEVEKIPDITPEEKELLKKASMSMKINVKNEEFRTRLHFPFTHYQELETFTRLTGKLFDNAIKQQMENQNLQEGMFREMPRMSSFDNYYKMEFADGEIQKKLDKDKYENISSDEYLNVLKEVVDMGFKVQTIYIIYLPRPAQKVVGKNVIVSKDKKKITIKAELDDLFDDPEKLEFEIKF